MYKVALDLGKQLEECRKVSRETDKGYAIRTCTNPASLTFGFAFAFALKFTFTFPANICDEDHGIASRRDLEQPPAATVQRPTHENTPDLRPAREMERASHGDAIIGAEGSRAIEATCGNDNGGQNTDWAFLHGLGDANDEFNAMDIDFRDFLGSGCEFAFDPTLGS